MTNDEWVKEWVEDLTNLALLSKVDALSKAAAAFGQEAIERGKAEERAFQTKLWGTVPASLAELEDAAFERGRQYVITRLENPDDALVEILAPRICKYRWSILSDDQKAYWREQAKPIIRALAATLAEEKKE